MTEHSNDSGWILKAPYVQNAQGFSVRTIKDIEGLKVHLYNICIRKDASRSVNNKVGVPIINIFEYLILQPCLNRAESKVILQPCLNRAESKVIHCQYRKGLSIQKSFSR